MEHRARPQTPAAPLPHGTSQPAPAPERTAVAPAAAQVEPTPDALALIAVDANELMERIRRGQDLQHAVREALSERRAA